MSEQKEIIIVGSGSTAFAAALRAESLGAQSVMIEKSMLGGTCINWGCVPSKTLIHAALYRHEAEMGQRLGVGTRAEELEFSRLDAHKNGVVRELRQTRYLEVLEKVPGLRVMKGHARFQSPDTVQVGDQLLKGERILIATGGTPRIPAIPGLESISYLTSKSALLLKDLPSSLTIVGGGVIALELGQMFCRLGVRVTILEHNSRLLPTVEEEAVLALTKALEADGIEIQLSTAICSVEKTGELTRVQAQVKGVPREFFAEKLLLAVGTAPASTDLGLDAAGVETDPRGYIKVDDEMRTTAPGIWAAGDVTGGMQLATVGAREGITAVDNMLESGCRCKMNYNEIPMAIFTDPEIGVVGMGEAAAQAAGYEVIAHTIDASAIPKAHVTGELFGAIKIVAEKESGRILGIHLATHRGADVINEAALAVKFRLTVADLAGALHVYPSIGEGLRLCAQSFQRDIGRLSCCAE